MSVIDKMIDAVTPPESEEARIEARNKARAAAQPGDWLSMVLDHHDQLDAMFAELKSASSPDQALQVQSRLAELLTGHAQAEETILYPAMAKDGQKGHATMAYTEQATTKMQLAELERLTPLSQEYLDKLGHIEGAVKHHMYSEEGTWFLDMKEQASPEEQQMATARFREEFDRYMNGPHAADAMGGMSGVAMQGSMGGTASTAA